MGFAAIIVLVIVVLAALYTIMLYNALVQLKHGVRHARASIDVQLRQRNDELSALAEACRAHIPGEQEALGRVMEARSRVQAALDAGELRALGQAETALRAALGKLLALADACPELKADIGFSQLQMRISALETTIADRRDFYNESVHLNNVRIEQFPDMLIARRFGFGAAERLEFTIAETADAKLASLFRY